MALTKEERLSLEKKVHELRLDCVNTTHWAHGGHVGGSMSALDIMTILYYKYMKVDAQNPAWEDRDRFVLGKGHAGIGLAPLLVDKGFMPYESLKTFNHTGSKCGIHLDSTKVKGIDASTGSLGHGLSIALGMGLSARYLNKDFKTYCLLGDGELQEGSVWEAAMAMAHYKMTNVITFVDRNGLEIDGTTEDQMALEPLTDKWESFGFTVKVVNGHSFDELSEAIDFALGQTEKPVVIIANTHKGYGIDFLEDQLSCHYVTLDEKQLEAAKASLQKTYENRVKGA